MLAVFVGIALVSALWLTADFTECYGSFNSREAAERSASAGKDAGLDASVEERDGEFAVTFESGESGADAAQDRGAFREILEREGGAPGHSGEGCVERGHFE